jgi:hypothetical protein
MPCACQLPPEVYPDAAEWGPLLWSVLHGLAEKAGTCSFELYKGDERRAWAGLFTSLIKTIPCPSCKEHYEVYLKEHPVTEELKSGLYEGLNLYVRTWFWELHNWVNESYGRPLFPFEDLTPTFRSVNIRQTLKQLDAPMKKAIRLRSGQFFGYSDFQKYTTLLLSIYGM